MGGWGSNQTVTEVVAVKIQMIALESDLSANKLNRFSAILVTSNKTKLLFKKNSFKRTFSCN